MAYHMGRKFIFSLLLFMLLCPLEVGKGFSQPVRSEEESPEIRLGEIGFRVREEPPPYSLKLIELNIEVLNRSKKKAAPPNSIRVVVTQKEVNYLDQKPIEEFSPPPQEASLHLSLPPLTGRILIFGFPIPREKVESITFEIHLNPPEGEKKMVTWTDR